MIHLRYISLHHIHYHHPLYKTHPYISTSKCANPNSSKQNYNKMDPPRFIIEPSESQSMAETSSLTLPQLLASLVHSARTLARPPISNFRVAALGVGPSGRIYVGVNLEFPGLPLHHSVHAEQFLITNMSQNAEPRLVSMTVSAAPCGHCRQFFQELRNSNDIQILITSSNNNKSNYEEFTPLSHFLPHRFGPHDLLPEGTPFLLEPHNNGLRIDEEERQCDGVRYTNGDYAMVDDEKKVKFAALEAANESHAPYSGSPSGVALVDCAGKVYKGSYVESAACNPSLGPVQAALVAFVAGGGGGYEEIVGAVLVEKSGAPLKQEETARMLLRSIAPQCQFKTFLCC